MNTILARKIKVTGCLNCSYYKEITNCSVPLDEIQFSAKFTHPSFNEQPPISEEYIQNILDYAMKEMCAQYFPDWCPLEVDGLLSMS